jgi:2-polyprenyl-3-methyl-5-hydroxy-6-metoxy-1,4-benzoquinol methylase
VDKEDIKNEIVEYWDRQPCNINHSKSELGTLQYFEEGAAKRYKAEPHIKEFADFSSYNGKRVLEIGCGIGADAIEFAKAGAEYVGIDISQESLNLAIQRFKVYNLEGKFYLRSGDEDLSDLGKFDLVYSFGVLHHYPDIQQTLDNIHDSLVDNGKLKFMVYAKNSWKYAMIQKGLDQYEAQSACPYAIAYTNDEIYQLLNGKFDVQNIKQAHCFMYNVMLYKQNIFQLESWFAAMPVDMRDAIREYLGWHLLVDAKKA